MNESSIIQTRRQLTKTGCLFPAKGQNSSNMWYIQIRNLNKGGDILREIKHQVKSPSRIRTIIGMIAIICSQSILVVRIWDQMGLLYTSLTVVLLLLCLVVLLLALYRIFFKKPTELCLSNDQIILNGIITNSGDIEVILTMGYFKPIIGIVPRGRKIVPFDMAFRYSRDEDRGISDLKSWAKMNNVKMVDKSFQTWI
ncbi:hypothetical protein GC102_25180 [Paenibacillus sp. LMG 31460]|uniref:DUF304 domain-containing protein n=1 Tax=Paenibacillus germinis TaxID=2654979 RepID=A0ABX1Z9S7_9BACL|nr:hypothetical protein [Paenibacillus germinis]NOU89016.1 hypothetical protein [Paenibacillus germinis]